MDNAIVLDVLPSGAPFTLSQNVDSQLRRRNIRAVRGGYLAVPIVFVLSKSRLFLMVAVTNPEHKFELGDEIDLNDKTKIAAWARISHGDLSSAAKSELGDSLNKLISDDDARFTNFFNRASPITTRMHSLELIPGIGKKHMWEILDSRRKPFESLTEIKERLPLIADLKKGVKDRILKELKEEEKYYLFVLPPRR